MGKWKTVGLKRYSLPWMDGRLFSLIRGIMPISARENGTVQSRRNHL